MCLALHYSQAAQSITAVVIVWILSRFVPQTTTLALTGANYVFFEGFLIQPKIRPDRETSEFEKVTEDD